MAKRGTLRHPKTLELADRLDCDVGTAFGILEALWHFTADFAPRGDVGRWTDTRIEDALEVPRLIEARGHGSVVEALIAARWLDVDAQYRLLVHDYPDHADEATKKKLSRAGLSFALPTMSRQTPEPCPDMSRHDLDSCPDMVPQTPHLCGSGSGSGKALAQAPAPAVETRRDTHKRLGVRQVADWDPEGLRRLCAQYPRADGIEASPFDAIPVWDALQPDAALQTAMLQGLEAWKACKRWRKDNGAYVMSLERWLSTRCWERPPSPTDDRDEYDKLLDEIRREEATG